jgi:hypothetical protein
VEVLDWAGIFGDVASVAGFFITVGVLLKVRSIERSFIFKARLPDLLKELKKTSANLLDTLQREEDLSRDSEKELARLSALLKSVSSKVKKSQRAEVNVLLRLSRGTDAPWPIWRFVPIRALSKEQVWTVYNQTEGLIESLKQAMQDSKWSQ